MENEYLENPMLEKVDPAEKDCVQQGIPESMPVYGAGVEINEDIAAPELADKQKNRLPEIILSQLDLRMYTKEEQEIFAYLAQNLDARGFLLVSAQMAAMQMHTTEEEIEKCVRILQGLEPAGVFSRNLEEGLILQLQRKEMCTKELEQIIQKHLRELADGRYNVISKALHISTVAVRQAAALIATLNPYPLQGYDEGETHYIVPDVLAGMHCEGEEAWEITLNQENLQLYRISDFYLHMLQNAKDPELSDYFQKRLLHARFLLKAIEQREKTICSIMKAVLDWQREYIQHGLPLKSMTMQDIGDVCGIHASTVSRAVRNKYLQYPGGTVLIKDLFTAMHTAERADAGQSPDQVKRKIQELIRTEDVHQPYSDQALTEILLREKMAISRRTVAKYRLELGIAPASARKVPISACNFAP